jgi:hypothetical protein
MDQFIHLFFLLCPVLFSRNDGLTEYLPKMLIQVGPNFLLCRVSSNVPFRNHTESEANWICKRSSGKE